MEEVYNYKNDVDGKPKWIDDGRGVLFFTFDELWKHLDVFMVDSDLYFAGLNRDGMRGKVFPISFLKDRTMFFNADSSLMQMFFKEWHNCTLTAPSIKIQAKRNEQRHLVLRSLYNGEISGSFSVNGSIRQRKLCTQTDIDFGDITKMLEVLCDMFSLKEIQETICLNPEDDFAEVRDGKVVFEKVGDHLEELYGIAVFILFFSYPVQFRLWSGYYTAKYIKHHKALVEENFNAKTPYQEKVILDEYNLPYLVPRKLSVSINSALLQNGVKEKLLKDGFSMHLTYLEKENCSGDDIRKIKILVGRNAIFFVIPQYDFRKEPFTKIFSVPEKEFSQETSSTTEVSSSKTTFEAKGTYSGRSETKDITTGVPTVESPQKKYKPKKKGVMVIKSLIFGALMAVHVVAAFLIDVYVIVELCEGRFLWYKALLIFAALFISFLFLLVKTTEDWIEKEEEEKRIKNEQIIKEKRDKERKAKLERMKYERGFDGDML